MLKLPFPSRFASPLLLLLLLPIALALSLPLLLLAMLDPRSWRFNSAEARDVLRNHLNSFRSLDPSSLRARLNDPTRHCISLQGASGAEYQIEVEGQLDDSNSRIVLMGSIDDGRLRAFFPVSESIILPLDQGSAV